MDNSSEATYSIRAVVVVDAHFYELEPTSPDVKFWQMVKQPDETDPELIIIREWIPVDFKAMLEFLDGLLDAGLIDMQGIGNPPPVISIWRKFNLEPTSAGVVLDYWVSTYSKFHTGDKQ